MDVTGTAVKECPGFIGIETKKSPEKWKAFGRVLSEFGTSGQTRTFGSEQQNYDASELEVIKILTRKAEQLGNGITFLKDLSPSAVVSNIKRETHHLLEKYGIKP